MSEKKSGGLFSRLGKTRQSLTGSISAFFKKDTPLDDEFYEDIEDALIMADLGVETAQTLVNAIRVEAKQQKINSEADLLAVLHAQMTALLEPAEQALETDGHKPFVILMVGVNGVGKTTSIAKLSRHFQKQGKKVMLAACDTYRAAAIDQLQSWGDKLGIPVVAQQHGSDAAAVAFDAYQSATAKNMDVLIIDTAGRQHTHSDLMQQLGKMARVLQKANPQLPHETLITVDASTGQNALSQIKHFNETVTITGLIVTKLDGTAKGGVMLAMANTFKLPIRFIGVGEQMDDFRPFNARDFAAALVPNSTDI